MNFDASGAAGHRAPVHGWSIRDHRITRVVDLSFIDTVECTKAGDDLGADRRLHRPPPAAATLLLARRRHLVGGYKPQHRQRAAVRRGGRRPFLGTAIEVPGPPLLVPTPRSAA
ncbi:MAG TPA: hypothetical protein VFG66_14070 [Gemmatimonadales bacterium]|nr:hypothetical protein [Gemmatimonadales bacterium]